MKWLNVFIVVINVACAGMYWVLWSTQGHSTGFLVPAILWSAASGFWIFSTVLTFQTDRLNRETDEINRRTSELQKRNDDMWTDR